MLKPMSNDCWRRWVKFHDEVKGHVEVSGQGAPLVMLHGWGMHGGIWQGLAQHLAKDSEVHNVDLPGHGFSAGQDASSQTLDGLVDALVAHFSGPLDLLGWSLGGMVAQRWAARAPESVRRLVLVTSTPCFTNRPGWVHGMAPETLAQFAAELEQDTAATLRRFVALQVRGSENERALLADLRAQLSSRGEPAREALRGGLGILREADLRQSLPDIVQPCLLIAGERDKLTPAAASRYLAETLPDARLAEIAGAAHAPFLSHPGQVAARIAEFLWEK